MTPAVLHVGGTPVSALRADLERAGRSDFGARTGAWLAFAGLLAHVGDRHAGDATRAVEMLGALLDADGELPAAASSPERRAIARLDAALRATDHAGAAAAIRDIASVVEDAGALGLADCILTHMVAALPGLGLREQGRVLAHRGRLARQAGDHDLAMARYDLVARLARRSRDPELRARALVGYGVLAIIRGNFPAADRWFTQAARAADRARAGGAADPAGARDVATAAHHGCLMLAGRRGETSRALVHGWLAFEHAAGDPTREAEMLLNVGAVLADAGDHVASFAAVTAALARKPVPRLALPALGGAAGAAAHLGRATEVRAATARIAELADHVGLPHPVADACLAAAVALRRIGDPGAAGPFAARARALAETHGFHQIAFALNAAEQTAHQTTLAARVADDATVAHIPRPERPWTAAARMVRGRVAALATPEILDTHTSPD